MYTAISMAQTLKDLLVLALSYTTLTVRMLKQDSLLQSVVNVAIGTAGLVAAAAVLLLLLSAIANRIAHN
jgi:hypothetical protein